LIFIETISSGAVDHRQGVAWFYLRLALVIDGVA